MKYDKQQFGRGDVISNLLNRWGDDDCGKRVESRRCDSSAICQISYLTLAGVL